MEHHRYSWVTAVTVWYIACIGNTHGSTVYMDHFGHCSKHEQGSFLGNAKDKRNYFPVNGDSNLLARGAMGSSSFVTKTCTITFRSENDQTLCAEFKEYSITDCGINAKVFDKSTASGHYRAKFTCHDSPHDICSTGKYLTFQLNKPSVEYLDGYNFEISITEGTNGGVVDTLILPIGVIVGIVVGAILAIVLIVVAVKCMCCDNIKNSKRKIKGKKYQSPGLAEPPTQPSAPPVEGFESHEMTASFHANAPALYPQGAPEPPPPYSER